MAPDTAPNGDQDRITTTAAVSVSVERARELLTIANKTDPGIEKGSTFSINERTRAKYGAIQQHGVAYGIRWTLDMLGLLPEEDE